MGPSGVTQSIKMDFQDAKHRSCVKSTRSRVTAGIVRTVQFHRQLPRLLQI